MDLPPPPNGQILLLVSALSSPENHELHVHAIQARDQALSSSSETYANLCLQLALLFLMCDHSPPEQIFHRIHESDLAMWRTADAGSVQKLLQQPQQWVPFGQMAGLILKNSLLHPPILTNQEPPQQARIGSGPVAEQLKECLLRGLQSFQHPELRAVASSIVADTAVSVDGVQPALHVQSWPLLIPRLLNPLKQPQQASTHAILGSLATIRKMLEDAPAELSSEHLDDIVTVLMQLIRQQPNDEDIMTQILQSLQMCLNPEIEGGIPNALVMEIDWYIDYLITVGCRHPTSSSVRQWSCRTFVTLLDIRPDYLIAHFEKIIPVLLQCTTTATMNDGSIANEAVALVACEFWLNAYNIEDPEPFQISLHNVIHQLIPILLTNMVHGREQQEELVAKYTLELQENHHSDENYKPIFHNKTRAQRVVEKPGHRGAIGTSNDINEDDKIYDDDDDDNDNDDDDDDFDDEDGDAWTLRKCSAATLDSMASLFGAEPILPTLLPALEHGLSQRNDPWIQEACVLALGAVAEGCHAELSTTQYLGRIHPYLLQLLSNHIGTLPQLQSTAAWTLGRYAGWAVEQARSGQEGHLIAQMAQILLELLLQTCYTEVQIACSSTLGALVEAAGDLMTPYLEPIYRQLAMLLERFYPDRKRSLLMLFSVFGAMADSCGPAIAEGTLLSIYLPPLLKIWDSIASHEQAMLHIPLMEALACTALTSGAYYQPYALQTFENCMCIIEMTTLSLSSIEVDDYRTLLDSKEDFDPIICATDLIDSMVEGLGRKFVSLVGSSQRYGPHFLSVLLNLCRHDASGVRMSALALVGDLARNSPTLIEPALPQLLREAVASSDLSQQSPSVCTNAVWAIGEICKNCEGSPNTLVPLAPTLVQNLLSLLVDSAVCGLVENAAACLGRLAKVSVQLVLGDVDRLLIGWCGAMGKITDPDERRDAYEGFLRVIYANPAAIHQSAKSYSLEVEDVMVEILKSIATWHFGMDDSAFECTNEMSHCSSGLQDENNSFLHFPQKEIELGTALLAFVKDMKTSVDVDSWQLVQRRLPVNVRRLMRELYDG